MQPFLQQGVSDTPLNPQSDRGPRRDRRDAQVSADLIKRILLDRTGRLISAPLTGEVFGKAGFAIAIIADRLLSAAARNQRQRLGLEGRP
jgi:hypothetical protein